MHPSRSLRPSEVISAQRLLIREQEALINVLKGALAAAGLSADDLVHPGFGGLTGQQAALVGALYAAHPRAVSHWALLEALPGRDAADDRQGATVRVQVCYARKVLGNDAIESVRGHGYRLGDALYRSMRAQRESATGARIAPEPRYIDGE